MTRNLRSNIPFIRIPENHCACEKARAHTVVRPYRFLTFSLSCRDGPLCPPDHTRRITFATRGVVPLCTGKSAIPYQTHRSISKACLRVLSSYHAPRIKQNGASPEARPAVSKTESV